MLNGARCLGSWCALGSQNAHRSFTQSLYTQDCKEGLEKDARTEGVLNFRLTHSYPTILHAVSIFRPCQFHNVLQSIGVRPGSIAFIRYAQKVNLEGATELALPSGGRCNGGGPKGVARVADQ